MSKIRITERDIKKALKKVINEQEEEMDNRLPVDDVEFELSDSDYDEIMDFSGPGRSFRGSIYYDGVVPETDDKEYDRKLALAVLNYERRKMNNIRVRSSVQRRVAAAAAGGPRVVSSRVRAPCMGKRGRCQNLGLHSSLGSPSLVVNSR